MGETQEAKQLARKLGAQWPPCGKTERRRNISGCKSVKYKVVTPNLSCIGQAIGIFLRSKVVSVEANKNDIPSNKKRAWKKPEINSNIPAKQTRGGSLGPATQEDAFYTS